MNDKPLMCFLVEGSNDPEDTMLVFETSSIAAKRRWANEHGDGDKHIAGISANRKKEWDQYAPGPVPALKLIEAGWWFECHGCGTQISSDYIGGTDRSGFDAEDYDLDREYGPDCTLPVMDPVEVPHQQVFCTQACHDEEMLQRRRIKTMERRVRKIMEARILKRFPDAILQERNSFDRHIYVSRSSVGPLLVQQAIFSFMGPGMKYGATLRVDDEKWRYGRRRVDCPKDYRGYREVPLPLSERERKVEWSVANGDREAFEAWVDVTKRPIETESVQ